MQLRPDRREARGLALSMPAFWAGVGLAGLVSPALLLLAAPFGLAGTAIVYRIAARESGIPPRTLAFVPWTDPRWRDVGRVRRRIMPRMVSPRWMSLVARQTGWPYAAVVGVLGAAFAAGLAGYVALVIGFVTGW